MQSNGFSTNKTLNVRGRMIDLTVPAVMGVLNVTPDSFFDGSRYTDPEQALKQARKIVLDGAAFIDVGGYSSRPGATDVPIEEEIRRVVPVIQLIARELPDVMISIDTFRAEVAQAALDAGAGLINDISGGELDAAMFDTVARAHVPYVLMHMRGTPQNMARQNQYNDLVKDILDYFHQKISQLQSLGVKDIIVDPGFGFAKNPEQNFEILKNLDLLGILGKPLLAGLSRKSMIWRTLNITPDEALNGTTVLNTLALMKGASLLRVHDVREATEAVKLMERVRNG